MKGTEDYGADLKAMGDLIMQEQTKDPYTTPAPDAFVPQTRRGFTEFINMQYAPFQLPAGPIENPPGEKYYLYQKFVREYMRNASPYRGILVYHGLGSGKTCTAIATAEALFASSHKKIIAMTPFSLRKNFLREVSFCGFRHFQLKNYWVKYALRKKPTDEPDPALVLFATQVLGLSPEHLKNNFNVWIPDFRKKPEEANYDRLPAPDRGEIRKQILRQLEWDPATNPTGRIRFVNYNGVTLKKLLTMACDTGEERFFDNAVIVVDEIHNLIRLIQGNLEPYMTHDPSFKKFSRAVSVEDVKPGERYRPTICNPSTKIYKRSYLLYRMLLDARNSRIVGLSGTPLINFPEELGILANVLHGYTNMVEGVIEQTGSAVERQATQLAEAHPFVDFVRVELAEQGAGTRVLMSILPPGTKKIAHEKGVERLEPEDVPPFADIVESIKQAFADGGAPFRKGELRAFAEPLLPAWGKPFREKFINADTGDILRAPILITRLSGLISYYKGSRLELMPRVKTDEVVRVPFSPYAQKAYSFKRGQEIDAEKKPGDKGGLDVLFARIYQTGEGKTSNNYKMGSRQACNFAFPPEVARPAATTKEILEEAEEGEAKNELYALGVDMGPAPEEEAALQQEYPELEGAEEAEEAEAAADDAAVGAEMGEADVAQANADAAVAAAVAGAPGGEAAGEGVAGIAVAAGEAADEGGLAPAAAVLGATVKAALGGEEEGEGAAAAAPAEAPVPDEERVNCKRGRLPGESYKDACARARKCLATVASKHIRLGVPDGLDV